MSISSSSEMPNAMYSRLSRCVGHAPTAGFTSPAAAPGGCSAARHALLDWTPRIAAPQTLNVLMLCDWGAAMCPKSSEAWQADLDPVWLTPGFYAAWPAVAWW
jgi:hypothetical protein